MYFLNSPDDDNIIFSSEDEQTPHTGKEFSQGQEIENTTRNLGLGSVFFSNVFKFVAISSIL